MNGKSDLRDLTDYHEDFLLWSEEQAELLRRRAAARPAAFAGLDIEHLAEEIGDLGKSELRAAESYLDQFFSHLIKIVSDPAAPSLDRWEEEVLLFRRRFRRAFVPSMRQLIDIDRLWLAARKDTRILLERHRRMIGAGVPERCPFGFAELLAEDFDLDAALARLGGTGSNP